MTPDQVTAIKKTFALVLPIKQQAGKLFYDRLFEIAPDIRRLFSGDMDEQARKLMDTLALTIGLLRDQPSLSASLQALGRRHLGYGVQAEHYRPVGEALIWTLEKGLGPAFTPEAREAWVTLYEVAAATMLAGAEMPDGAGS